MSDYFAPAAIAAGWPHQEWVEVCERWDKKQKKFVPSTVGGRWRTDEWTTLV